MSRGGRGARGGRGGAQNTGRPEIDLEMKVSYEELPLFPKMHGIKRDALTAQDRAFLKLDSDLTLQFKASMYYRHPPFVKPETPKYSDKFKPAVKPNLSLKNIPTDLKFFPDELHVCIDKQYKRKKLKLLSKSIDWNKLSAAEQDEMMEKELVEGEDEEGELAEEYDEEAEEDDNDYLIDHYDEDNHDDDVGGNGGAGGSDND